MLKYKITSALAVFYNTVIYEIMTKRLFVASATNMLRMLHNLHHFLLFFTINFALCLLKVSCEIFDIKQLITALVQVYILIINVIL